MVDRVKTNSITQLVKIVAEEQAVALMQAHERTHHKSEEAKPLYNQGELWAQCEDHKLIGEFYALIEHLAISHGRTKGAIRSRLQHLNIMR